MLTSVQQSWSTTSRPRRGIPHESHRAENALAVYGLLDLQLKPPGVYKGKFDPRVLLKAFRALHDIAA
jgi:myosin-crossreactive antigen